MKKILFFIFTIVTFYSCSNDNFGSDSALKPVSFTVNLNYDKSIAELAVNGGTITLTNTNTGTIYTEKTGENGVATFTSILPGTYNLTATQTLTDAEFNTVFGYSPDNETVTFNGSQEQVLVNANVTATAVTLKSARIGGLVIKQIYYAGSSTSQGAVFRDQFIEIYNNSNEIIYADGLCIGQLYGKSNTTTYSYTLANGQYDWNKSIGITAGTTNANTNYVYADYVIQVPGNGTQYPINPGESIVIAQTGINHKSPLVDNSGEALSVKNPDLTVDLSTANFEVYVGDYRLSIGEDVYRYDIQNPAVTDMTIAYWGGGNKDFLMDTVGRDSFIIFRSADLSSLAKFSTPDVTAISADTNYFLQIPTSTIIDGVELQHYNLSSQRPKMLQSEIDASSINCDAAYNSQSVIRKTKTTLNGRIILEDTNNSSADFVKLAKAEPKTFVN